MDALTAKNKRPDKRTLASAVIKVGDGRGFVVENKDGDRLVITAAHCLEAAPNAKGDQRLPPAHPWSYAEERTYPDLLGPLDATKSTVWAECIFADPIADIAVLRSPDNQAFVDEAEAYEAFTGSVTPLGVVDAPKQGSERLKVPYPHTALGKKLSRLKTPTPGRGAAKVLSLAGKWLKCTVTRRGSSVWVDQEETIVEGGMSGSPILAPSGQAIGLVSSGSINPVLVNTLPPRIKLRRS